MDPVTAGNGRGQGEKGAQQCNVQGRLLGTSDTVAAALYILYLVVNLIKVGGMRSPGSGRQEVV